MGRVKLTYFFQSLKLKFIIMEIKIGDILKVTPRSKKEFKIISSFKMPNGITLWVGEHEFEAYGRINYEHILFYVSDNGEILTHR